jgi:hypothetical protein
MTQIHRDDDHWYDTPIGKLPGATVVLKVLNKPWLVGWAAKQTGLGMADTLRMVRDGDIKVDQLTEKKIGELVKKAKTLHGKASTEAMDLGSRVHKWIEGYFQQGTHGVPPMMEMSDDMVKPIRAFLKWDDDNKVRPICVEERIWSEERYAGTLDFYGEVGGTLTLLDFKSSTQHGDENILQLGAYAKAFYERTGNKVDGYQVVRLDKLTGIPDPKEFSREEVEIGGRRFLALLKYWWLSEVSKS